MLAHWLRHDGDTEAWSFQEWRGQRVKETCVDERGKFTYGSGKSPARPESHQEFCAFLCPYNSPSRELLPGVAAVELF